MVENKGGTVSWSENTVILRNPSQSQCMEVISKISVSHKNVVLFHLTRDCIEMLLQFILNRGVEKTMLLIHYTPMHGLVNLISSQISTLKTLSLIACSIDDDDVIPLAQALKHNTSLFQLCLSYNPGITSESVHALAELLLTNNSLHCLTLQLKLSHFGLSALFESLGKNKNMKLEISEENEESCKSIPSYFPVEHRIEFV